MTEPTTAPHHETEPQATTPESSTGLNGSDAQVVALAKELADSKDQLLRALAEVENIRRRAQKEREDTARYAVTNFAKDMLAVSDNFARALEVVPQDSTDTALKNLVVGIEATGRQLQASLERFGIKKLDPLDQIFDPNFHRVMMEVDGSGKPAGTVTQVLQAGYVIHDRLLREALVAIAKGDPTTGGKVNQQA